MSWYAKGTDALGEERIIHVHTPAWHQAAMLAGLFASLATIWSVWRTRR